MKKFVKKSIAVACTAALFSSGVCPIATNAEETVLQPKITGSWQDMVDGSRKADINVSYDKQYSGYKSITALYDTDGKLLSCGMGTIGENGSASYEVNDITADKAAHYIWNYETLEPAGGAYRTTYAEFVNSIGNSIPEFNVTEGLGIRHSFESGRFQIFQAKDTYNVAIADDVLASTGVKCAKISNRSEENATLRIKLQASDISGGTTLNVSADMKKPNNITDDAEFYITVISVKSKTSKSSTPILVTDNEWHNINYSVTLSDVGSSTDGYVVQLGARTGSAGAYKYIDYYADDFTVTSDTTATVIYDDIKVGGMKWDFEDGVATDWVTTHYKDTNIDERAKLDLLRNANKWTYVLKDQKPAVENTSDAQFCNTVSTTKIASVKTPDSDAVTTPPEGSTKMLSITEGTDWARTHISTRIKLSKWDLVPGKTYNMSFWAFGNSKKRALYTGLLKHEGTTAMPTGFSGGSDYSGVNKYDKKGDNKIAANTRAPGIIQYDDYPLVAGKTDYLVNYVASMPRSWHKYTVTFTPEASAFDSDGYTNLYFVMAWDRPNSDGWYDKDMLMGEKLYLDEIEITEADTTPGEVVEITNDGLYTKRATFETDSMDMFAPNAKTKSTITNETAHTGEYSVMYTGREGNWQTLVTSLKGADPTSTITASCYLRNYYPTKSGTEAKFRLLLPKENEKDPNEYVYSDSVSLDGAIWTELRGTFDLSDYPEITEDNISKVNIDIVTVPEKSSYYADDFMLKSDTAGDGTFVDDYTLTNNDESISKTATSETYKTVDLDAGITSLYSKYADKFKIGGTLANDVVTSPSARNVKIYNKLFKKHFNTTASDGYFKMEEILKNPEAPDEYTFDKADQIMKFCYDNGVTDIVGHALIWDKEGAEKYFFDDNNDPKYTRDDALSFMKTYIETVINHFNGKGSASEYSVDGYESWNVNTWDVVNEAVNSNIGDIILYKGTGFYHAIGSDYGKYAFKYAHDADPDAELRYNDYGEHNAEKAEAVCKYVKTLTDPTDSSVSYVNKIGVQSHYDIESDINTIKESLDKYAAISSDIKLDITELDIKAYTKAQRDAQVPIYENGIPKSVEYKQAKLLRDLFDKYELMSDKIDRVNFWTFSDLYAYPNREGFEHKEYAGIFDRKFAPKPQYYILVDTPAEFNARYPDYSTYITD